ncbi:MAG TPA: DNA polymerase III subunit delta [Acidimicrobiales bacterium]|nr:DNA polymerase III subunit delta [Acidimicrobiales bacterium]
MTRPAGPEIVLVDGNDPVLVAEAMSRAVEEALAGEDRSLALEDYSGEEVDLAAVADACATPPFLAGRRVVLVRDVGRWNTEEVGPLLAYLEDPLETTALVLVAGGGPTAAKLAAAVKARGRVVSTNVDSRQAGDWVNDRIRRSGLGLDAAAAAALREHLGEDASRLIAILEVLEAAYGTGGRLTADDIQPYLGEAGSVTPWAFTDSIDAGDAEGALTHLHRLLEGGRRHPLVVLAILHRHITSLMRVDSPAVRTEAQAAEAMGIAKGRSTFPAKKALRAAGQWGSAHIAEAVALVADAEVDLKGHSGWPEEAVLEVLVARLCRLARGRPARAAAGTR